MFNDVGSELYLFLGVGSGPRSCTASAKLPTADSGEGVHS